MTKFLVVNQGVCGGHIKVFEIQDKKKVVVREDEIFAHSHKEVKLEAHQGFTIELK